MCLTHRALEIRRIVTRRRAKLHGRAVAEWDRPPRLDRNSDHASQPDLSHSGTVRTTTGADSHDTRGPVGRRSALPSR